MEGMFECNICLEEAAKPMVTRCGHLFCWACLRQWLDATASSVQQSGPLLLGERLGDGRGAVASSCPICKASVTKQSLIPVLSPSSTTDPRHTYPDLPLRAEGEAPEPEPASAHAARGPAGGSVPARGYAPGHGYFPVLFGLNWQGASLRELPAVGGRTARVAIGLASIYFFTLVLI
mmetsp:Transcript_56462/g.146759  ORF Transcript_56462/g.146759 Transcript_56462/m.146759 type:complete len:177 (+) Transcript_56462:82-612(+)